ncbi:hypothetical protein [Nonomuraea basaltis]|uniref:hypothetical protein n=1 Tax=Nonomuraea basaltis TaxID=2495887 RepID=UPI00110C5447|nr:hypothetical protein [Nonomuraea basaltis]TMR88202.1 hypothetical protein EJK15_67565 [Nonomuraea basaltis]
MSGYSTIPFTIAFANEEVKDPIVFEVHNHEYRLTYRKPRLGDWVHGILRGRVKDLLDRPDLRGPERMRKLNTRRQWRCMDKLLCQVCGEVARDPETGRTPWALPSTVFERTGRDSGRTNAPPTCWSCIPKALEECPMLREDFALYTVAERVSAGVLADLYQPGILSEVPILSKHNVFVAWDAHRYHGCALAVAQVVELRGMISVSP